jgi:hypothetical protein
MSDNDQEESEMLAAQLKGIAERIDQPVDCEDRATIARAAEVVEAAESLYDNRLGWSDGRNPYAPPSFWEQLNYALRREALPSR